MAFAGELDDLVNEAIEDGTLDLDELIEVLKAKVQALEEQQAELG